MGKLYNLLSSISRKANCVAPSLAKYALSTQIDGRWLEDASHGYVCSYADIQVSAQKLLRTNKIIAFKYSTSEA